MPGVVADTGRVAMGAMAMRGLGLSSIGMVGITGTADTANAAMAITDMVRRAARLLRIRAATRRIGLVRVDCQVDCMAIRNVDMRGRLCRPTTILRLRLRGRSSSIIPMAVRLLMVLDFLRGIGDTRGGRAGMAMAVLRRGSARRLVDVTALADVAHRVPLAGLADMAVVAGALRAIPAGERSPVDFVCLAAGMSRRLRR